MPLSVFPPRKSAWEQSGDDIRAVWQDVGDSLRWSMDEYDREHGLEREREHEIELRIERGIKLTLSHLQQLEQLKLELARTKAQKQGKSKAGVMRIAESNHIAIAMLKKRLLSLILSFILSLGLLVAFVIVALYAPDPYAIASLSGISIVALVGWLIYYRLGRR